MAADATLDPPPSNALRSRLRGVSPASAEALRRLFSAPRSLELEGWALTVSGQARSRPRVCLRADAGGQTLGLALDDDRGLDPVGERHWSDYSGDESRLLALGIAAEPLLNRLGAALCTAGLLPLGFEEAGQRSAGQTLGWALQRPGEPALSGQWSLDEASLLRLAGNPGWQALGVGIPASLSGLLVHPGLALAIEHLSLGDWQGLEPGDVLVLGRRSACLERAGLWLDGRLLARISLASGAPTLSSALLPHSPEPEPAMNASAPAATPEPLLSLNLPLEVEVGRVSLTLAELSALRPGTVLELGVPVEGARVTLRSRGQTLGRGELVVVGEMLGVQVDELCAPSRPADPGGA